MGSTATRLVASTDRGSQDAASDAALVIRARQGDGAAFEALAGKHVKTVISLVHQGVGDLHAAEDAAQDALLQAYRRLNQLDDPTRFAGWLYRIALRQARRSQDSQSRARGNTEQVHEVAGDSELDERRRQVREAVAELDEPIRLVVTLRFLEGLNAAEIAERLNEPHGTIRARLSRARPILREKLRRFL